MGCDSTICMNILSYRCNCYTGLIQCFGVTSGIHSAPDGMVTIPQFSRMSFILYSSEQNEWWH